MLVKKEVERVQGCGILGALGAPLPGNLCQNACFAGNLKHPEGNPERSKKLKQEIWSLQEVKKEILDYMCSYRKFCPDIHELKV